MFRRGPDKDGFSLGKRGNLAEVTILFSLFIILNFNGSPGVWGRMVEFLFPSFFKFWRWPNIPSGLWKFWWCTYFGRLVSTLKFAAIIWWCGAGAQHNYNTSQAGRAGHHHLTWSSIVAFSQSKLEKLNVLQICTFECNKLVLGMIFDPVTLLLFYSWFKLWTLEFKLNLINLVTFRSLQFSFGSFLIFSFVVL